MRTLFAPPLRGPHRSPLALGALALGALALAAAPAWADVPHRCEAVFVGPTKTCELLGTWTVSGVGRSQEAARKVALSRLGELMIAALDERAAKTAGTASAALAEGQRKSCPAAAPAAATVVCYAEPALADDQLCFGQLRVPECYRGPSIDLQGVGYKVVEKTRDQICAQVDLELEAAGASAFSRLSCQVECMQRAEVRCAASGAGR